MELSPIGVCGTEILGRSVDQSASAKLEFSFWTSEVRDSLWRKKKTHLKVHLVAVLELSIVLHNLLQQMDFVELSFDLESHDLLKLIFCLYTVLYIYICNTYIVCYVIDSLCQHTHMNTLNTCIINPINPIYRDLF